MLIALTAVLANAFPGWASAAAPAMHVSVADEEFNGPFPSWGNVKNYGAKGDGVTDDTAALQSALNSMAKRSTNRHGCNIYLGGSPAVMYLPKGTYKITGTLYMTNKLGVELVGEDPANTSIVWAGPTGGTMMILDGVHQSRYGRITWNGSGTAGIGIAQWYNTKKVIPGEDRLIGSSIQHIDEVFTDMGVGIQAGCCGDSSTAISHPGVWSANQYGQLDSEGSIRRTKFIRNTVAGLSVESYNALDWWVWDSEFTDCGAGLTNMIRGAGNFMAYRNTFTRSKKADIHIGNTGWFSMHNNVSTGSKRFYEAAVTGLNSAQIIIQNNRILDTTQATSILNGNLGPVFMLDNQIRSLPGAVGPVFEANGSTPQSDLISVGNRFTANNKFKMHTGGEDRLLSLEDQVVDATTISATPLPAIVTATNQNRTVFEVPVVRNLDTLEDSASTDAIQAVINQAAASTAVNPIVHLPTGTYYLTKPLVLPARKRLQLMGDGMNTRLMSTVSMKAMLLLQGPSYATVRDLYMRSSIAPTVVVENSDQVGGRIFLNGVTSAALNITDVANTRIEGQANTNFAAINATAAGSVLMMGTGGIGPVTINSGSNIVMNDTWYEGQQTKLFRGDPGNFTYLGGLMAPADTTHGGGNLDPAVSLTGFAGQFTMAGVRMNLKNTSNGIFIGTEVPETKFLGLGVYASYPIADDFFQRSNSDGGGDVRFTLMKAKVETITSAPGTTPIVATYKVRQLGDNGQDGSNSVLAGLAQTRGLIWDAAPYVAPEGVTDVRFYRVKNVDAPVGFEIINGVK